MVGPALDQPRPMKCLSVWGYAPIVHWRARIGRNRRQLLQFCADVLNHIDALLLR